MSLFGDAMDVFEVGMDQKCIPCENVLKVIASGAFQEDTNLIVSFEWYVGDGKEKPAYHLNLRKKDAHGIWTLEEKEFDALLDEALERLEGVEG